MTAQPQETVSPGQLGLDDAAKMVTAMHSRGVPLDEIDRYAGDRAASALSEAVGPEARDYARAYDDAARSLVRDLQADDEAGSRPAPEPGSPHPSRPGWTAGHDGVYRLDHSSPEKARAVQAWQNGGLFRDAAKLAELQREVGQVRGQYDAQYDREAG